MQTKNENKDDNTRYTCLHVRMRYISALATYSTSDIAEVEKQISAGKFTHRKDFNHKDAQSALNIIKSWVSERDYISMIISYVPVPNDPEHVRVTGFYDNEWKHHPLDIQIKPGHEESYSQHRRVKRDDYSSNEVEKPRSELNPLKKPASKPIKPATHQKADDIPQRRFFAASKSDTKKEESPSDEKGFRKGK